MDVLYSAWSAGASGLSPLGLGFAVGFLMWLLGTALFICFRSFTVGAGLDSNDD